MLNSKGYYLSSQGKSVFYTSAAQAHKDDNLAFIATLINKKTSLVNIKLTCLQNYFQVVILILSELRSGQNMGLRNPISFGLYCIVIRSISQSKYTLLTVLTCYLFIALRCYDWVGAEYNSRKANNARRLMICGFLTTQSPNNITMARA